VPRYRLQRSCGGAAGSLSRRLRRASANHMTGDYYAKNELRIRRLRRCGEPPAVLRHMTRPSGRCAMISRREWHDRHRSLGRGPVKSSRRSLSHGGAPTAGIGGALAAAPTARSGGRQRGRLNGPCESGDNVRPIFPEAPVDEDAPAPVGAASPAASIVWFSVVRFKASRATRMVQPSAPRAPRQTKVRACVARMSAMHREVEAT